MKPISDPLTRQEGHLTRFLLTLVAIGASLMLLSGAMLPVADGDVPPFGLELLSSSLERMKGLLGG
ncbi:hypothetical protein STVA_40160 [Allostella vacuolata]|nr:hypothetical protein STVA_40160 [Stella vacuolata]